MTGREERYQKSSQLGNYKARLPMRSSGLPRIIIHAGGRTAGTDGRNLRAKRFPRRTGIALSCPRVKVIQVIPPDALFGGMPILRAVEEPGMIRLDEPEDIDWDGLLTAVRKALRRKNRWSIRLC